MDRGHPRHGGWPSKRGRGSVWEEEGSEKREVGVYKSFTTLAGGAGEGCGWEGSGARHTTSRILAALNKIQNMLIS